MEILSQSFCCHKPQEVGAWCSLAVTCDSPSHTRRWREADGQWSQSQAFTASSVSPDILSLLIWFRGSKSRNTTSTFLCPIKLHFPGDFICLFMIISKTFIALPSLWSGKALDLGLVGGHKRIPGQDRTE